MKWQKGIHVFLKTRKWSMGDGDEVVINRSTKYKIRSIGKKQAIIDRIIPKDVVSIGPKKGTGVFLTSPSILQHYRDNNPGVALPNYYDEKWSDVFAPAGDEDWDSEENYY